MSTTTSLQFEGSSIEEALAAAVDALGDDLEIVDAQRITKRGLGLRRREIFEVTATKRELAEPKDFEDVLKRMVARVDEAERQAASRGTPPPPIEADREWWTDADFVIPSAPPLTSGQEALAGSLSAARNPNASTTQSLGGIVDVRPQASRDARVDAMDHIDLRDVPRAPGHHADPGRPGAGRRPGRIEIDLGEPDGDDELVLAPPRRARAVGSSPSAPPSPKAAHARRDHPGPWREVGPVWSLEALSALGLPRALVARVRPQADNDLAWVSALAAAIEDLFDAAGPVAGPCEITGHGVESVIPLIQGAFDGYRVAGLVVDGRAVPATSLELALAVRALLRGES